MSQTIPHQMCESATQVRRSFDISVPRHCEFKKELDIVNALPGVVEVSATSDRKQLFVTYDVRRTIAEEIQKTVGAVGLAAPTSFWRRMRIAWLNSLDTNRRENAAHRPACCSKPPPGVRAKHHQR